MYFKKPVIVRLQNSIAYYTPNRPRIGVRDAVMELDRVKLHRKYFKRAYRKFAYDRWFENTKLQFVCVVCGRDGDPDTLIFHHLGEEFTGRRKLDSISSMVKKQLPLYRIENEMSKCATLCANCHQKYEKEGKEALEELYNMSERHYGIYYAPGESSDSTEHLREQFIKNREELPIELVGFFDIAYLNKYNGNQNDGQDELEDQVEE